MTQAIGISDALDHRDLFEPFFRGESWSRWRAVLKAAHGEKLTAGELEAFRAVADRDPPSRRVKELVCAVGRGGGKDSIASLIATLAAINFVPKGLRPGERVVVMCLACDRAQAGIVFGYIKGYFEAIPALRQLVLACDSECISLRNRVDIEVHTNSFRGVRGRSLLCVTFDELAFWRDDSFASPDTEVHSAVTPGLARVPDSMLIMISSAHKRSGLLYNRWREYYGRSNDDILVVCGKTLDFNPSFDASIIERDIARDPQRYNAEYNSIWRDDLSSFIDRGLLDCAVDKGVMVRPPQSWINYFAGCDSSGGRNDSFTAALAHREGEEIILDCVYERRPPLNPGAVVKEISGLLKDYRCTRIVGDRYGGNWPIEAFGKHGVEYLQSERDRSALYSDCLPLFTTGRVRLVECEKVITQFANLERRTFSTGRDRIDPGPGHDDCANSVAIALTLAARGARRATLCFPGLVLNADGSCCYVPPPLAPLPAQHRGYGLLTEANSAVTMEPPGAACN
jgi:hypothetical protein